MGESRWLDEIEADPKPYPNSNQTLSETLKEWRNRFSVKDCINRCKSVQSSHVARMCFSVAILCAGGLLDTCAAVRMGFLPVWGTEICSKQRFMWNEVTGAPI